VTLPAHEVNQLAGGTAYEVNSYTGPARELLVDTDSWTLRLQDAALAGGHVFAPLNVTDSRYQRQSSFLDLVEALEGNEGFLYVNPVTLTYRKLDFVSADFVTDPGFLPSDDYKVILSRDLIGDFNFADSITATGGFYGALTGDVTGDTVGTHTGPTNGTHTGSSNGTHSGPQVGDVDLRSHTLQLDPSQIPDAALSAEMQAMLATILRVVPVWGILLWDSTRAIPSGWQECDGSNGTINLRGRVPFGVNVADSDFAVNVTGGTKNHTHGGFTTDSQGDHNHGIVVNGHALTLLEMPPHDHTMVLGSSDSNLGRAADGSNAGTTAHVSMEGGGDPHDHTATSGITGAHTHGITIPSLSTLPPYQTVFYIQRII